MSNLLLLGEEGVGGLFFGHFDSHVRTIKTPEADAKQRKVTHLLEQTSHPHLNEKRKKEKNKKLWLLNPLKASPSITIRLHR